MPFEASSTLKIAYEAGGPSYGLPVVLLHGCPDDAPLIVWCPFSTRRDFAL